MNRTTAKRLIEKHLPMLSAYANGSQIEYKDTLGKWALSVSGHGPTSKPKLMALNIYNNIMSLVRE